MSPLRTVPALPSMLPGTGFGSAPCAMTSVPPRFGVPAAVGAAAAPVAGGEVVAGAEVATGAVAAGGADGGAAAWHAASKKPLAPRPRRVMNWRLFMTPLPP